MTLTLNRHRFGTHDLADVLTALNRACKLWLEGQLPLDRPFNSHKFPFFWLAGETARLAIVWCRAPNRDRSPSAPSFTWQQLLPLLEIAMEALQDERLLGTAESQALMAEGDVHDSLLRIIEPQHLFHRETKFRPGQALLMYDLAAKRLAQRDKHFTLERYEREVRAALGCDINGFVLASLQIHSVSAGESYLITEKSLIPSTNPRYHDTPFFERGPDGRLLPAVRAVLRVLSASPKDIDDWMVNQCRKVDPRITKTRALLEAPNPLLRFPLVRVFRDAPDHCIAPVPHLVSDWLYESLPAYLYDNPRAVQTQNTLAALLEEYVGKVLEMHSPEGKVWLHERDLKPTSNGRKCVDWACVFDDTVLLVEVKKAFIEPAKRYRSLRADWEKSIFKKNWAKAVDQGTDFWDGVRHNEVVPLASSSHKRVILLVVTLTDADLRSGHADIHSTIEPHLEKRDDVVPYVIVSLDRLEHILSAWENHDVEWLPKVLRDATERGSNVVFREVQRSYNGSLAKFFKKLVDDLAAVVNGD